MRRRFPRATILSFWHIPWPDAERFAICPYQDEILEGLLGSSIVGFQTPQYCHNFLESVDRTLEVRIGRRERVSLQARNDVAPVEEANHDLTAIGGRRGQARAEGGGFPRSKSAAPRDRGPGINL